MIAWWMAQIAILGTLLAVAAYGAETALTAARRATRWVWVSALLLTVAMAAAAPTRRTSEAGNTRTWTATVARSTGQEAQHDATMFDNASAAWLAMTDALTAQVQRGWTVWHELAPATIDRWLLTAWLGTSVMLLCTFAGIHWRYQRRRLQWPLGSVGGTTVRIAHDTGPAVIGVTSAEIVVPQWLLTRDRREQDLVLAHELEHVRLHDPMLLMLAQVAVVLLPWHPAVWWMASRLRLAVELDCDRRVLQRGASARDYGTLLIDLTDHRTGFGAALPAFSCSPSHLERRLVAMTPKRMRYPLVRAISAGALASLALLAACEARLPTSDEMDRMTASTATAAAGRVAMIDTATVAYYVNDALTTKAIANSIAPESIASINVVKLPTGGQVRIVSRREADIGVSQSVTFTTPGSVRIVDTVSDSTRRVTAEIRLTPDNEKMSLLLPARILNADTKPQAVFTGLMIIDGVIVDAANSIDPNQVVSVEVIKGVAATQQYSDPRAANGVIKITTKNRKL